MSNMKKKPAAKKAVKKANAPIKVREANLGENPFVMEKGVKLSGHRTSSVVIQQLTEAVRKLPVDPDVSVLIPKSIASKANEVTNLVLGVRRMIAEDKTFPKNFTITLKTFKDAQGGYVNSRIWRIA